MGSSSKQTISVTRPCLSNLRSSSPVLPCRCRHWLRAPNCSRVSSLFRRESRTGFPKPKGLLKPSDLGPRGPRHPRSWRVCQGASLSPAVPAYRHTPSWSACRMSLSEKTPRGPLSWTHRPPLDAIMRVPTRRQGRGRVTYQSRISGMRLSLKRERLPFLSKVCSHLVSTTTAQPEDIKLALSGAEPPPSEVEGAWEERGGGSVYDSKAATTGTGSAGSGRARNVWVLVRCLRNQGGRRVERRTSSNAQS